MSHIVYGLYDSDVDSNDPVAKNVAANFNNDLQALLKLIILKTEVDHY